MRLSHSCSRIAVSDGLAAPRDTGAIDAVAPPARASLSFPNPKIPQRVRPRTVARVDYCRRFDLLNDRRPIDDRARPESIAVIHPNVGRPIQLGKKDRPLALGRHPTSAPVRGNLLKFRPRYTA